MPKPASVRTSKKTLSNKPKKSAIHARAKNVKTPPQKSLATTANKPAKKIIKKTAIATIPANDWVSHGPRQVRQTTYKKFRLQKRIKHPHKIPSAWKIFVRSILTIWSAKKLFTRVVLIYGFLNIILVRGFGDTSNIATIKKALDGSSSTVHVVGGLSLFAGMAASSGNKASSNSSVYQLILVIVVSLVVIWSFRQVFANVVISAKDAFYNGTYPLVQFVIVLVFITLQFIPAVIGSALYSLVANTGIAAHGFEKVLWGALAIMLFLVTLYMLASSVFALYIVTLPDMTPRRALRSARNLVSHRRWTVLRKILFLPLVLLVISAVIVVPIILTVTSLATWVFFILSMAGIVVIHGYMYTLYRELLV
jgi:hypothetical protein